MMSDIIDLSRSVRLKGPFMLRVRYTLACLLCALQIYSQTPQPQSPLLDDLVAANSRSLRLKNGAMQGSGADFIVGEAARAQFIALGEEHNTTEIPEFTSALFGTLQERYGFRFLAAEQDPITLRWI